MCDQRATAFLESSRKRHACRRARRRASSTASPWRPPRARPASPLVGLLSGLRRRTWACAGIFAAAWAMWEQADFGREVDIVEATDLGAFSSSSPAIEGCRPSPGSMPRQRRSNLGSRSRPRRGNRKRPRTSDRKRRVVALRAGSDVQQRDDAQFWQAETARDSGGVFLPALALSEQRAGQSVSDRGWRCRVVSSVGRVRTCCARPSPFSATARPLWTGSDGTCRGARNSSSSARKARPSPLRFPTSGGVQGGGSTARHPGRSPSSAVWRAVQSQCRPTWDVFNFTAAGKALAIQVGRPSSRPAPGRAS